MSCKEQQCHLLFTCRSERGFGSGDEGPREQRMKRRHARLLAMCLTCSGCHWLLHQGWRSPTPVRREEDQRTGPLFSLREIQLSCQLLHDMIDPHPTRLWPRFLALAVLCPGDRSATERVPGRQSMWESLPSGGDPTSKTSEELETYLRQRSWPGQTGRHLPPAFSIPETSHPTCLCASIYLYIGHFYCGHNSTPYWSIENAMWTY